MVSPSTGGRWGWLERRGGTGCPGLPSGRGGARAPEPSQPGSAGAHLVLGICHGLCLRPDCRKLQGQGREGRGPGRARRRGARRLAGRAGGCAAPPPAAADPRERSRQGLLGNASSMQKHPRPKGQVVHRPADPGLRARAAAVSQRGGGGARTHGSLPRTPAVKNERGQLARRAAQQQGAGAAGAPAHRRCQGKR
jgi:hypothetical protein